MLAGFLKTKNGGHEKQVRDEVYFSPFIGAVRVSLDINSARNLWAYFEENCWKPKKWRELV
jgi:hypothetical protein